MLNANHPDDERLSSLASGDDDAVADAGLTAHVSSCDQCTELVTELGALRTSLAQLPDLAPDRPLRLLPEVAEPAPAVEGLAGWVRRLFAPALAAGAALAMVGLVGTASPALDGGTAGGGSDAGILPQEDHGAEADAEDAPAAEPDLHTGAAFGAEDGIGGEREAASPETDEFGAVTGVDTTAQPPADDARSDRLASDLPAERSPWPMVLFSGVALMIGAGLLRWILVPRAG